MNDNQRMVIIGGGLSGLTLAYLLSKRNIKATVLEASARLGGRIQTIKGALETPLELGATWFSDMHPHLLSLIEELGLHKFPQYSQGISLFQTSSTEPPQRFSVPDTELSSYRLVGGTQMLIDTLADRLADGAVLLNTKVTAIKETANGVLLETSDHKHIEGDKVIVCIPPQLLSNQIRFEPKLPDKLMTVLPTVQTWMAGSIKFTLEYDHPFWRTNGYSGMVYSHVGIISEMYDHTNFEETKFGFTGFLNSGTGFYSSDGRKDFVIRQLEALLGEDALEPIAYFDKVWADGFVLAGNSIIPRPHYNNGHPLLQESYMNGKLYFSATETSTEFPGYMEGAVIAARSVAERI